MSQVVFKFRPHHPRRDFGITAQVIGERIEVLKKRHAANDNPDGFTTPEEVLEDARDPASPLHPCFTWDQDTAALEWNLYEARWLITSYEIHVLPDDREPIVISPGNVSIRPRSEESERGRVFASASFALSDEDRRDSVLADTYAQLSGIQRRLVSLKGITQPIITLLDEVMKLVAEEKAKKGKGPKKPGKPTKE